jgi:hypothetical protein
LAEEEEGVVIVVAIVVVTHMYLSSTSIHTNINNIVAAL